MTTRRNFMMILGGGIIAAAGGAGTWAMTRDPANARKPWETARVLDAARTNDPRRYALSHAILAPNPHNRQPWVVDLATDNEVTLYFDTDRRLPHTDPHDRQLTIGLGCFIELFTMAAAETGHRADVTLFPAGEPQPVLNGNAVAHIRLVRDKTIERDPLFAHVLDRHTNREPFDTTRPVSGAALIKIAASARAVRIGHAADQAKLTELRKLAWDAMDIELRTHRTAKESIDLLRIGKAEIEANPDGISLAGPLMEGLDKLGLMSREDMLDTTSTVFQQQIDAMRPSFDTAMAFLWLSTPGNSRFNQIAAGRDYVRIHLAITAAGLAMQPLSQALQEYEEMADMYAQMRKSLGIGANETLQMFVRLGYGPQINAAPRWTLETRIKSA